MGDIAVAHLAALSQSRKATQPGIGILHKVWSASAASCEASGARLNGTGCESEIKATRCGGDLIYGCHLIKSASTADVAFLFQTWFGSATANTGTSFLADSS